VLKRIAEGKTNRQIAGELFITKNTFPKISYLTFMAMCLGNRRRIRIKKVLILYNEKLKPVSYNIIS